LVAAAKFLAAATKKSFVVPNFVAVTKPFLTKPFFFVQLVDSTKRLVYVFENILPTELMNG